MWDKLKEQFNVLKLEKKKLYLITNSDKFESKDLFLDAIASALQGGVDIVELYENSFSDNILVEIAKKVRVLCDEYGATFIINGRCDIALISEADGVCLKDGCVSIEDARHILGEQALIGFHTNTVEDAISAYNNCADFITFSSVFTDKKSTKININDIEWINENIEIPIFYKGKINFDNIDEIVQTRISRIALTDAIMYARIPEETARNFLLYLQ